MPPGQGSPAIRADALDAVQSDRSDAPSLPVQVWHIPCLRAGTRVATLRGLRPVETLSPGDRIVTHARGSQPLKLICAIGAATGLDAGLDSGSGLGPDAPGALDEPAAILIEPGAFGDMRPIERLVVSPQQPVFVRMSRGSGTRNRYHDTVLAKFLVNDTTVVPTGMGTGMGTSPSGPFYAIGFERPEVIQAENLHLMCLSAAQIARMTGHPLDT